MNSLEVFVWVLIIGMIAVFIASVRYCHIAYFVMEIVFAVFLFIWKAATGGSIIFALLCWLFLKLLIVLVTVVYLKVGKKKLLPRSAIECGIMALSTFLCVVFLIYSFFNETWMA